MKKILLSLSMIAIVGVLSVGATGAFFSDTETSTGNTFTAGTIDLKIDSEQHYNGNICTLLTTVASTTLQVDGYYWAGESSYPAPGSPCTGTWEQTDLGIEHKFFNFDDIKPGDEGENTISVHIDSNPAWMCVDIAVTKNDDVTCTEPENGAEGVGVCQNSLPSADFDGELAQNIEFFSWLDQGATAGFQGESDATEGDNIWQATEPKLFSNDAGPLSDAIGGKTYALADGGTPFGPIPPGATQYIGLAWCAGTIDVSVPGVFGCSGASMGNNTQTDSAVANVTFRVEQSRNNEAFRCAPPVEEPQRATVGAANYIVSDLACDVTADDDGVQSAGHTVGVTAISSAITEALAGDVICVAPGTYNEFVVNKSVTIMGLSDPEGGTPAVVVPSSSSVTDLALVSADNVTVTGLKFDGNSTITNGQSAGVRISPASASLTGVNVTYNVITNIAAATGFSAKGVQWWTDTDSGFVLSNSNIKNNTISNIDADNKGAYGVQTVGAMSNVAIENNTISNSTGAWGGGVAVDTKNTTLTSVSGSTIALNQIMSGVSDGVSRFAVQVENRVNATGVSVNQNNLETVLHGGGNAPFGTEGSLNAQSNWWGVAIPVLATDVFNTGANVTDFTLPEASAFSQN